MRGRIDLNADLGEGCGDDAAIMRIVTRCNIACGGHAGDTLSMTEALALAMANKVVAGAHPSYPDRENFGRTQMDMSGDALHQSLSAQVAALKAIADDTGIALAHVKPHGALYNFAAQNLASAEIIADVAASLLPGSALLGPPNSKLQDAAEAAGLEFIGEAFADRVYEGDGSLRARSKPGALITNDVGCAAQAVQIALKGIVTAYNGDRISMAAKTICLHSDTPSALISAQCVLDALEAECFEVTADVR